MRRPSAGEPVTTSVWWRAPAFVRLLLVRLLGQVGDGVTQAALASYALFSDRQADPVELAAAAAVVLLPYSVLGPFVGVLLDRWSRRQVLLVGNLVRSAVVLVVAVLVGSDAPEVGVYAAVLVALGVNRFLLSGLSAALPHTVPVEDLTPANALTPTLGTAAFVAGLGLGGLLRAALDDRGEAVANGLVVAAGVAAYLLAAGAALLTARRALGPDHRVVPPSPRHVAAGLVAALRHLRQRPVAAGALVTASVVRWGFGLLAVSAVLTLRNSTFRGDADQALAAVARFTGATAVGFLAAAVLAPWLARRLGRAAVVRLAVVLAAGVLLAAGLAPSTELGWAVLGLAGGVAAQGVKVCADALVQEHVDDDFRGRVFSLYDLAFNVAVVTAAVSVAAAADDRGVPTTGPLLAAALLVALVAGLRVGGPRRPRG
ncbi:MFS transporter [Nocardioides marmoribigeumensis]|uniref:MFS family permease n=1 Tax=Nocardioides marmoribigeumensis TaxID=433649 RepID=A0ABU2BUK1_9ACTN|nr:MFS transporter [Nocardioides marmoribigeumensis]MDR7362311.1 MFS family permease [Nocardioides marmoribigeumensis]